MQRSTCDSLCRRSSRSPTTISTRLVYYYIFIYIRVVRRALNLLRVSFSPIFQYFSAVNVTRVFFSPVFQYFVTYVYICNWAERERTPSCGLNGRAVTIYIYTSYGHRYCACAALRANVAGRIGNRVSPAESAFSACIGSGSSQT